MGFSNWVDPRAWAICRSSAESFDAEAKPTAFTFGVDTSDRCGPSGGAAEPATASAETPAAATASAIRTRVRVLVNLPSFPSFAMSAATLSAAWATMG